MPQQTVTVTEKTAWWRPLAAWAMKRLARSGATPSDRLIERLSRAAVTIKIT